MILIKILKKEIKIYYHKNEETATLKPYFILKTLREKLNEGDYLIYTDAGILYTNSTDKIINFLNEQNSEMWMIRSKFLEKSYTKRDAFYLAQIYRFIPILINIWQEFKFIKTQNLLKNF